ncbi:MAG: amidohydrolase [Deltaproteobacteria bacterium]|nr:amidohydrolase [Deltaproteobacteria bacterium]
MFLFILLAATPADLVVTNAKIHSLAAEARPGGPRATALAVKEGRIIYVGDDKGAAAYEAKDKIDAGGKTIVPGLIDAHAHLRSLGGEMEILDLHGCKSAGEIVTRVQAALPKIQKGQWLEGRGWDQNDWTDKRFPSHETLSAATPNNPVILRRVDGHAALLNAVALKAAGIDDKTKDPAGGRIGRDERGAATGILLDDALELVTKVMPKRTKEDLERQILAAQEKAIAVGLTGMHDMGTTKDELAVLRILRRKNLLKLRVYVALDGSDDALTTEEYARGKAIDPMLTVRAVKLYADGALGSRGASLLKPYSDDPKNGGLRITNDAALLAAAQKAKAAGFQVCVHAIGDAAVRATLDVFAKVAKADDRYRVEHAQVVDAADWPRFQKLEVIASMQPTHATSDMDWAEARLGHERVAGAYAWRSLMKAGARLAFGSDFPVEHPDPLFGLYAAITRTDHAQKPAGGWRVQEAMTPTEALRGFTLDAAYAGFSEGELGTLEIGKRADFVVLSVDPLGAKPQELLRAKIVATVVGGKRVYGAL